MALLREDQFAAFLSRQMSKACGLLIYGEDDAGVSDMARQAYMAATKNDSSAVTRLSPSDLSDDQGRLLDEVQAMSLLGGNRAVLLEGATDTTLKALTQVLALESTQNFLIVTASSLNKGSKLREAFEKATHYFCLPLYEAKADVLERRVMALLSQHGLSFADGAFETFFALVGAARGEVMREAEKLALYAHGQSQISEDDVKAVCGDIASFSEDELVDSTFSGDLEMADRALQVQLQETSMRPPLNALLAHVAKLMDLRLAMARGATADTAIANAKPMIFFGRRRKFAEHLRALDLQTLEELQTTLTTAVLDSRKLPDLSDSVISRAVLNTAWRAAKARR